MKSHSQTNLVAKANHERIFQEMRIDHRMQYLSKLEDRAGSQDKNLRGLVQYAKTITADLEVYKQKVETSEKIVSDLKESGNECVNSLLGMLKMYKKAMRNT